MENLENQNTGIKAWAESSLQQLKNAYIRVVRSTNRSGNGLDSLKLRTGKYFGVIDKISFSFNRYLIFMMKGAGKGQGGKKGSVWVDKQGMTKRTKTSSLGKMNRGARQEKDFVNPVLDREVPKLADIVANFKADQVVKAIKIK